MSDRTLVKMTAMEHCVLFRTVTRARKSPHTFYMTRDAITGLSSLGETTEHDGSSFAVVRRNDADGTISICFTWLSGMGEHLTGWDETITLPREKLLDFLEHSAQPDGVKQWNTLSLKSAKQPKLVFCGRRNLRAALGNKTVRRKLVRFLRDNFHWERTEEIRFYDDFEPYSFFFQEFSGDQPGMCGGLILHGQEDLTTARYSIHT